MSQKERRRLTLFCIVLSKEMWRNIAFAMKGICNPAKEKHRSVGPRVPVFLEALKRGFQLKYAKITKKSLFPSGFGGT
jgi:hypothetical protein